MKTQRLATHESEDVQESVKSPCMGRLTFGDMYLERPVDDQHKANRKVLGVLGREVKDSKTGKQIFTFQELADQLAYGDRRDVQNFHRELRQSDFDVQAFVTRKATKHDRLFPLIEAAILDTPLLSPHQQYVSVCADHPNESLSEETFRKYANDIDGMKLVTRFHHLVQPGTERLDVSRNTWIRVKFCTFSMSTAQNCLKSWHEETNSICRSPACPHSKERDRADSTTE